MAKTSPARWIDRLTTALLAASVGVVAGAATPSLLRLVGDGSAPSSPHSFSPILLPQRPPELLAHPDDLFGPADGLVDPDGDGDEALAPAPRGELGLTRARLTLHERPAASAEVVGSVPAGELVTLLRVVDDWALVYYTGAEGIVVGYAKKSEIAVR